MLHEADPFRDIRAELDVVMDSFVSGDLKRVAAAYHAGKFDTRLQLMEALNAEFANIGMMDFAPADVAAYKQVGPLLGPAASGKHTR